MTDENTWYHLYNHPHHSWQWFKANHITPVDLVMTEILIKAVNVKTCARFEEYLTEGTQGMSPHFWMDLHGERESVKDKIDHRFSVSRNNGSWLDLTWVVLGLSSWRRVRYCSFCCESQLARLERWLCSLAQTTLHWSSLSQSGDT